jgi:lipoteichoic acid synthase
MSLERFKVPPQDHVLKLQESVSNACVWLGSLAVGRAPRASTRSALTRLSPVIVAIVGVKLIKLLLWHPTLPSGVEDGSPLLTRMTSSGLLRIVIALAGLSVIRHLWFRKRSNWWVLVVGAGGLFLSRIVVGLRGGEFSPLGSWTIQKAILEFQLLYLLLRQDLLACLALLWIGIIISAAISRRRQPFKRVWAVGLVAPLLLLLGIDLAHFVKTGLMGTGHVLSFLARNAAGTWFLLKAETSWFAIACLVGPLMLIPLVPRVFRRHSVDTPDGESMWGFGLALIACSVLVATTPAAYISPAHARFAGNPLIQLASDAFFKRWTGINSGAIETSAHGAPLLFDARIATAAPTQPTLNVVIVMLESVRALATQLYDPRLTNTPFLQDLASRGALVENMYAVVPRTSAAWIAILHGIYPGDDDIFFYWGASEARNRTAVSLPRVLRQHGYRSAFFVPTHLNLQNDRQLIDNMGFDHVVHDDPNHVGRTTGPYDGSRFERINIFGFEDRAMLGPIASWIDEQNEDRRPFFLTVMTNVGHYPYDPPKSWMLQALDKHPEYNAYLNSIAYVDGFLRDLFAILEDRNLTQNTVVVILGDHGESFGEHGPRQHFGQAYEEVLRIPAVLFAPGLIDANSRIAGLRQQPDIMPTILDLLGITVTSGHLAGVSLLTPPQPSRKLYFSGVYEDTTLAMRAGDLKHLYNFERTPMEVYDLHRDPKELSDLANHYSREQKLTVQRELLVWRASVNRALMNGHPPP